MEDTTEEPIAITHCPECKRHLINIVTGSVCPQGCGKLHPLLNAEDSTEGTRLCRLGTLAKAISLVSVEALRPSKEWVSCELFAVDGKDGVWRRVKKLSASISQSALASVTEGTIIAYVGGDGSDSTIVWLRRDSTSEADVAACFPAKETA